MAKYFIEFETNIPQTGIPNMNNFYSYFQKEKSKISSTVNNEANHFEKQKFQSLRKNRKFTQLNKRHKN